MGRGTLFSRLISGGVIAFSLAVLPHGQAGAQDAQKFTFAVPQENLADVLTEIGRLSKVTVSVPSELVAGRTAGPVMGEDTVQGALARALEGSGLVAEQTAEGVYVIHKQGEGLSGDIAPVEVTAPTKPVRVVQAPAAAAAPAPAPSAAPDPNGDVGFQAGSTGNIVGIAGAKIKDTPLAIAAVSNDVIQSQRLSDSREAARNVAGVIVSGNSGQSPFNVRGFYATGLDAFRVDGQPAFIAPDSELLERVEVLKGPTSIFTGISSDGGVVNFSRKVANGEEVRELMTRYDTYFGSKTSVDVGGAVKGVDGLNARIVASGDIDTLEGENSRRAKGFAVLPSLMWKNDIFEQTASVSYEKHFRLQQEFYFLPDGGGPLTSFEPYAFAWPLTPGYDTITKSFNEKQTVKLGKIAGLEVTVSNRFAYEKQLDTSYTLLPFKIPEDASPSGQKLQTATMTDRAEATISYKGSLLQNNLQVLYDWKKNNSSTIQSDSGSDPLLPPDYTLGSFLTTKMTTDGFGATDKLDLFANTLHLLGSVRKDWWTTKTNNRNPGGETNGRISDGAVSWSVGGVYDLTNWVSVYGNVSHGVQPGGVSNTGVIFPPMINDQTEGGLRFALLNNALTASIGVYDQEKTNLAIENELTREIVLLSGQTSRGAEFQLQGALFENLQANVALSYVDVSYGNFASVSQTSVGSVPAVSGSAWMVYTFDETTPVKGLSLGLGLRGNSGATSLNNPRSGEPIRVPGYLLVDSSIGYTFENWSLNLKVTNLFDRLVFQPTNAISVFTPEQERTAILEARLKF